jgi:hypothetical protein
MDHQSSRWGTDVIGWSSQTIHGAFRFRIGKSDPAGAKYGDRPSAKARELSMKRSKSKADTLGIVRIALANIAPSQMARNVTASGRMVAFIDSTL